jgi:CheY-like chemotaxis protein
MSLAKDRNVAQAKQRLLIVDDDKPIRHLLARLAHRAGFDAETAKDGHDALEKLRAGQYDIVVIDLMMPRISGFELIEHINTLHPRPTVIVATAMTNGDLRRIDDSMIRRVIRKPFDIDAVMKALIETAAELAAGHDMTAVPAIVKEIIPGEASAHSGVVVDAATAAQATIEARDTETVKEVADDIAKFGQE